MRRPLIALACITALAGAAGCGESDQEQARELVQDYVDARNSDDFEAVCDTFSDSFKQELATTDCPAFVEEQTGGGDTDEDLSIVDVHVNGDVGTADLDVNRESQGPSRVALRLERQDGDWAISGLQ